MNPLLLLALLLTSCSGDEEKPTPDAAVVAPAPPPVDPIVEARKLAAAGRHQEALASAEKAVTAKPEDDSAWRLMSQEAIASGQSAALLDRLDAAQAIGGRVGPHQLLRAELALTAGRPADALAAALAAQAVDPDAAAANIAAAALAGANVAMPAEGEPATGATALAAWVRAADAVAAEPYEAAANAVGGWRAAMLRGGRHEQRGQLDLALADYEIARKDADPRGQIAGGVGLARVALQIGWTGHTAAEIGDAALAAADVARAEADGASCAAAFSLAMRAWTAAGATATALEKGTPVLKALVEAGDGVSAGKVGLALAEVARQGGELATALKLAGEAAAALSTAGATADASAAAWTQGIAAFQLGRGPEVASAAEAASGAQQQALRALAALAKGDVAAASAAAPSSGLSDGDAVLLYSALARSDASNSLSWWRKASAAAQTSGDRALQIFALFGEDEAGRQSADGKASLAAREALTKLVPEGAAGDALRLEIGVRAALDGGKPTLPGAESGDAAAVWAALMAGVAPAAGTDDPLTPGVRSWAQGRAALSAGPAAPDQPDPAFAAYSDAFAQLPLHRHGALSVGTALDGSMGLPVDGDIALLGSSGSAPIWMAVHELDHIVARRRWETGHGVDHSAALPTDQREALLGAVAVARAATLSWLSGRGAYPKDALRALSEAEARVAKTGPFASVLPSKMPSPAEIVGKQSGLALVSYRVAGGRLQGVAMSKKGNLVADLGPMTKVNTAIAAHMRALRAGAQGTAMDPGPGDQLRKLIFDPFAAELSGVGRYVILAPPDLITVPFATLPEQSSGLRWLVDIRSIGALPSLRMLTITPRTVETYNPDFLGFGDPNRAGADNGIEDAGLVADELRSASRVFAGGLKEVLTGPRSTAAAWTEKAATSRYAHFADILPTGGGGFQLADGPLTLDVVRATPLAMRLVVITADAPLDQQLMRGYAMLDAGAQGVVLSSWPLARDARSRLIGAYYDAIGRDRSPARALTEAREQLSRDTVVGAQLDNPGIWGGLILLGEP